MYYIPEPLNPKKDLGRFSATCFTYLWVMLAAVFFYVLAAFFIVLPGQGMDIQKTQEIVTKFMEKDGGAYIIAPVLVFLLLQCLEESSSSNMTFVVKDGR